mmetsp:Transcript_60627/g.100675  ORF Transcript_60627/g.100675 Transcript_60627/m.100675 type:complete len:210 (-) Transcript_60627:1656-2285(-)
MNEGDITKKRCIPKKGLPQGSIIGPACCNVVLNGLQEAISKVLPKNARFNADNGMIKHSLRIHNKTDISSLNDRTRRPYVTIETIRFADDIIIVAKMSDLQIIKIVAALKTFLRHRGVTLKNTENDNYWSVFKPGASIDYLGFNIIFPDIGSKKFRTGKFTKFRFSPDMLGNERFRDYTRSPVFLAIGKNAISKQKKVVKEILQRKNIP